MFHPAITYTVPTGWKNYEDTAGNFLLVPPDGDLPGVNGGTSDFIGIYTSVGPPRACEEGVARDAVSTPAGYRTWATHQPGFRHPRFRPVSVGGLSGLVVDLRLARGWSHTCPYANAMPMQQMITCLALSALNYVVHPIHATRLYLMDYLEGALAIEVVDIKDAHHLPAYTRMVRMLRFGT